MNNEANRNIQKIKEESKTYHRVENLLKIQDVTVLCKMRNSISWKTGQIEKGVVLFMLSE